MQVTEKINALRQLMAQHNLSAYIVPGTDPHQSEYMAEHWTETTWLSGFKGESGTVVVTTDHAMLWTDSRYYLQAEKELQNTGIELMRASDIDCPTIEQWLCNNLSEKSLVGVNPQMWSDNAYNDLKNKLNETNINIKSIDLIAPLWTDDRPAIPNTPLYEYSEQYAGQSVESKLQQVRNAMTQKGANALVVSALDEIAWLLNIRGYDVEYNPVVISYVVVEQNKCTLFVNSNKLPTNYKNGGLSALVNTKEYDAIYDYLATLQGVVMYDGNRVNRALVEAINPACQLINTQSPILYIKSKKNAVELDGERSAMRKDAVALTRFFYWLETEAFLTKQTEWTLMEKLHEYRAMGENFIEESFCTIAGYKGNGAIVHYSATKENCAEVKPEGMLLLDSGGQYLDGTTDITRTVWLGGDIPQQAKLDYTYVLKGHIALATSHFPKGTRGNQLDALAKQYMWQAGITYGHGTGHGVGHFLGCHEGPQNIRTDMNPTVLEVGQICSDEPGIYRTGEWGIRIENLITIVPAERTAVATTNDRFLMWETLTLCYYDKQLIERSLLTDAEIQWINDYHQRVAQEICPLLNTAEAEWLQTKCSKL